MRMKRKAYKICGIYQAHPYAQCFKQDILFHINIWAECLVSFLGFISTQIFHCQFHRTMVGTKYFGMYLCSFKTLS